MGQREAFTNKLADVVQILQLARQSGFLTVEHSQMEGGSEQGTIVFVNGQISQASAGRYRGEAALLRLKSWRTCRFAFLSATTENAPASTSAHNPRAVVPYENGVHKEQFREMLQLIPAVPYRLQQVEDTFSRFPALGLSRVHRHLFLLVDGQRPMKELARLLGRSIQQTSALLSDLERARLIKC